MTKNQSKKAQEIFSRDTEISKLWMNPKGEFFTSENLGKGSLKKGEVLELVTRQTKIVKEKYEHPILGRSVPDVKVKVGEITNQEALEKLLQEEKEGQNRKGAKSAIRERLEALKADDTGSEQTEDAEETEGTADLKTEENGES